MSWITIDVGNTRIKIARWEQQNLLEVLHFDHHTDENLQDFAKNNGHIPAIISSVRSEEDTNRLMDLFPNAIRFNHLCPIPLKNGYEQPDTLGMDRLANAIAAYHRSRTNTLIIDAGTCLKCDFVSADGTFLGGSISPGLTMRLRSLHDYTGKLPLIEDIQPTQFMGTTTVSSCLSGVLNGMRYEMEGFIAAYKNQYPELTIFLTGGDAPYFEFDPKSAIFASDNLTLEGLLLTLQHVHA